MRIKKPTEEMVAEDAESYAASLGVTVDDLKNTTVTLYDIITAKYDEEAIKAFSSASSVFRATNFYTIRALLKKEPK